MWVSRKLGGKQKCDSIADTLTWDVSASTDSSTHCAMLPAPFLTKITRSAPPFSFVLLGLSVLMSRTFISLPSKWFFS